MSKSISPVGREQVVKLIDLALAGQCQIEPPPFLGRRDREALQARHASQQTNIVMLHNEFREVALTAEWSDLGGVDDEPFVSVKRQGRADPRPPRLPSRDVILRFGLPREKDLVLLVRANDEELGPTSALALRFDLATGRAVTLGVIELQQHPGKLVTLYCPRTRAAFASAVTLYDALYYLDRGGWS